MGGTRRRDLPDGCFHVTARGVNGSAIFLADVDRLDFLDVLARVTARVEMHVVARGLMDTHYHLIVESTTTKLSAAMQRLNSAYALRLDRRHRRQGHLFGRRDSS